MMRLLFTAIFLILLSGTIMSQYPPYSCYSLTYKDTIFSEPQTGHYSFKNAAYLNGKTIYIYDNSSKRAVPQPGWQHVENWDEVSQFQKKREDLIMKNLQEIINSNEGKFAFTLYIDCSICPYKYLEVVRIFFLNGEKFIKTNKNMLAQTSHHPTAEMIKQKLKQDKDALNQLNAYLEKQCPTKLQRYKTSYYSRLPRMGGK
ncbi:zinc-alpha-2-glycoprotein-like [Monodelphis domestica]|uniref:zinc-alpha-2-glycoprotein-like n=1 Tax=Monodelphis domestica TaxID=13616 RepID=UPI0024E1A97B|nr:zinc-alpha-2-glycoprotein-like [Monodelphis domestica]